MPIFHLDTIKQDIILDQHSPVETYWITRMAQINLITRSLLTIDSPENWTIRIDPLNFELSNILVVNFSKCFQILILALNCIQLAC